MTKIDVLLGLQWGDEGKGKIVDVLTPEYDVIARFQGPNQQSTCHQQKQIADQHDFRMQVILAPAGTMQHIMHHRKANAPKNDGQANSCHEEDIIRPLTEAVVIAE